MKKIKKIGLLTTLVFFSIGQSVYATPKEKTEINNLVVFLDFQDEQGIDGNEEDARAVENTFNMYQNIDGDNDSDNNSLSLKSYIYDVTRGDTEVNSTFYPKSDTTTGYVAYTLPESRSYYEQADNVDLATQSEYDLLSQAIKSVETQIVNDGINIDTNNDGKVDGITFIYAGTPATSGVSMLRPHKASFADSDDRVTINGKELDKYIIIGTGSTNNNVINGRTTATLVHEYLHMLGYPDLYNTSNNKKLVDVFDLMGAAGGTPQLPLVYSRNTYGDNNLKVLDITKSGEYTLSSASITNPDDVQPRAIKIKLEEYPNEYFMIEYRKTDEKWDSKLDDIGIASGVIVYRINETVPAYLGNDSSRGIHIYVFRPGETTFNQGAGNIKNATLSLESKRTTYGVETGNSPNSIYYDNGTNSGITITNVGSAMGETITLNINIPEMAKVEGQGTKTDPYQLNEANDFKKMAAEPNAHYKVVKDIDFSDYNFSTIPSFNGILDGQNYTLSNLEITETTPLDGWDYATFVGKLNTKGVIKNIKFEQLVIQADGSYAAGVAGYVEGEINNVTTKGSITTNASSGVGGLVGEMSYDGKLINSKSYMNITSNNVIARVGGLVGNSNDSFVENNYFNGKITSVSSNTGAIFGRNAITATSDPKISTVDNVWNISQTGLTNGTGTPTGGFGETSKGLVGLTLIENQNLEINALSTNIYSYNPNLQRGSTTVTSSDLTTALIEDNKVKGLNNGTTSIIVTLNLGDNIVTESIEVVVGTGVVVDKTNLNQSIQDANEKLNDTTLNKTQEAKDKLQAIIDEAQALASNDEATQSEVDTMNVKVKAAIQSYINSANVVDKTNLNQSILNANEKLNDTTLNKTQEAKDKLQAIIDEAQVLSLNDKATQSEVDTMNQKVKVAIQSYINSANIVDKTNLNQSIQDANEKLNDTTLNKTQEAKDKLQAVINEAQVLASNDKATQSEVDTMNQKVKVAIQAYKDSKNKEDVKPPIIPEGDTGDKNNQLTPDTSDQTNISINLILLVGALFALIGLKRK